MKNKPLKYYYPNIDLIYKLSILPHRTYHRAHTHLSAVVLPPSNPFLRVIPSHKQPRHQGSEFRRSHRLSRRHRPLRVARLANPSPRRKDGSTQRRILALPPLGRRHFHQLRSAVRRRHASARRRRVPRRHFGLRRTVARALRGRRIRQVQRADRRRRGFDGGPAIGRVPRARKRRHAVRRGTLLRPVREGNTAG